MVATAEGIRAGSEAATFQSPTKDQAVNLASIRTIDDGVNPDAFGSTTQGYAKFMTYQKDRNRVYDTVMLLTTPDELGEMKTNLDTNKEDYGNYEGHHITLSFPDNPIHDLELDYVPGETAGLLGLKNLQVPLPAYLVPLPPKTMTKQIPQRTISVQGLGKNLADPYPQKTTVTVDVVGRVTPEDIRSLLVLRMNYPVAEAANSSQT